MGNAFNKRLDSTPRLLSVRNNSTSAVIPAYGCLKVVGYDGQGLYKVDAPATPNDDLIFAGPLPIPGGGYGVATRDFPCLAAYGGSAPAAGSALGPVAGSYQLASTGSGYVAVAAGSAGVLPVRPAGGGSAGAPQGPLVQVTSATPDPTSNMYPALLQNSVDGTPPTETPGAPVWAWGPNLAHGGGPLAVGYYTAVFRLTHSDGMDVYYVTGTVIGVVCVGSNVNGVVA